jgi:hypothetical protein
MGMEFKLAQDRDQLRGPSECCNEPCGSIEERHRELLEIGFSLT